MMNALKFAPTRLACWAAVLIAAPLAAAWAAEPRGQVEVIGEIVTVGDLFADAGAIADQAVFYAPPPGQAVEIGPNFLHRVALGFDLDWRPGQGVNRVVVRRAAQAIDVNALAPIVLDALAARLGGPLDPAGAQLAFDTGIATRHLPVGVDPAMTVRELNYDPRSQRFSATIDIAAGTSHATNIRASGRLRSVVMAPVLARAIGRSQLIGPDDVHWMEVDTERLSSTIVLDADSLIGFTARRALGPNQPINAADVLLPLAVRRGETVIMVLEAGSISLTAQGRALDDGSAGDVIRIVNTQSSRVIDATVEGPGTVRITAPGAALALGEG